MSVLTDFVAGTVGGASAVLVEYPFDTVKTLLQAGRYNGYVACFSGEFAKTGVRGFYRGMSARLVASGFEHAVIFASYKWTIRVCGGDEDRPSFWEAAVGGCGAGVASTVTLTPFELVKCKLQTDDGTAAANASAGARQPAGTAATGSKPALTRRYTGPWDCVYKVFMQRGIRGLYDGAVATLYREVPGTAVWCGTYDFLKMRMTKDGESPKDLPLWKMVLAGGCSGVAFWTAIFPADVVKTRMQVDPSFAGYSFSRALARQYREVGVRGLYRGWALTAARSFPSNAMIFMCYDVCSGFLTRQSNSAQL